MYFHGLKGHVTLKNMHVGRFSVTWIFLLYFVEGDVCWKDIKSDLLESHKWTIFVFFKIKMLLIIFVNNTVAFFANLKFMCPDNYLIIYVFTQQQTITEVLVYKYCVVTSFSHSNETSTVRQEQKPQPLRRILTSLDVANSPRTVSSRGLEFSAYIHPFKDDCTGVQMDDCWIFKDFLYR